MLRICIAAIIAVCFSCNNNSGSGTVTASDNMAYRWTRILDSGPWRKSYNFNMFNIRDTLWVFHPDGNWFSANGQQWTKASLPNAIHNLAFMNYVHFKDAVYGLGHFVGNIEQYTLTTTIFRSSDMKKWDTLAKESNLPQRFFYKPFVFQNKIWFIGGEDQTMRYSDIWNTEDGVHWVKQRDSMPFGKRIHGKVVELNGKLYLLNNDVWTSADGLEWQLLTPEIVKGQETFGYQALVYDNKIWLIGCNRNGQFLSKVMYSDDGKHWKDLDAPWSPRGGMAAAIFKNKIWMTGGKYGGTPDQPEFVYSNDLWTLSKY